MGGKAFSGCSMSPIKTTENATQAGNIPSSRRRVRPLKTTIFVDRSNDPPSREPTMTDQIYHAASRVLQDRFDTRRLADRIESRSVTDRIDDEDREFIERRDMFFLSTVDHRGYPTCSYKGGDPGFVRVLDERTIAFPNYDGNGMYLSMGNVATNRK